MFKRNVVTFCFLTIFSLCSPSCALISSEKGEGRILGGVVATGAGAEANRHLISVASIRSVNTQGSFHVCGGFIINKHWIGTAAQCMTDKTITNTAVSVGSTSIGGGILYDLNRIEMHSNYNALTLANDIALLRTIKEIIFSAHVNPIPIYTGIPPIQSWLWTYGWGRTAPGSNLSDVLRVATFETLSYEDCLNRFPFVARRFITDRQICSFWPGIASCPGDAGGPQIFNGTVAGIVSWVEPCVVGQTNVNTRISVYANWIFSFTRADD